MNEQTTEQVQDLSGAQDAAGDMELRAEQGAAEDQQPEPGVEDAGDELSEQERELAALQEALQQTEAQAAEYLDGWQRARAEFANYRRREDQRRGQASADVSAGVLSLFLPVLDDLERAFSSVPAEVKGSPWFEGLVLVAQKMQAGMEKAGVAVMNTQEGDAFDPNYHMAVLHCPSDDYDEGQVAAVLQRGYKLGERVLRPAMVQVSSGKSVEDTSAECECEQDFITQGPADN